MKKSQFNHCIILAGKSFSVQAVGSDKMLDKTELEAMCREAENYIKGIYPDDEITLWPYADTVDDFAGFRIQADVYDERVEFDFGSQGVDVV